MTVFATRAGSAWRVFETHRGLPYCFFLDRSDLRAPSFAGSRPSALLSIDANGCARSWRAGAWKAAGDDPIEAVDRFVAESEAPVRGAVPDFARTAVLPRTVGYLAYELGRWIEKVPAPEHDSLGLDLALLCTYDSVDAWDPEGGACERIVFDVEPSDAQAPVLRNTRIDAKPHTRAHYESGFASIQSAIAAGDIYQANLARRIEVESADRPDQVYARMREVQAVGQGVFFDAGGFQILSNSPETLLRIDGERISSFPIKGTRRNDDDAAESSRLAEELRNDPEEAAEHVMIVDLVRNDLGRVCETGSVRVHDFARLQTFSTVQHLVSEVRGTLRTSAGTADVLRAVFPGGSITGAPKIKAMELIAAAEGDTRGVYTGSVGCFHGPRQADLNIAIRTAVAADGRLYYNTGGGIVADSSLSAEYDETVVKAEVFRKAVDAPCADPAEEALAG